MTRRWLAAAGLAACVGVLSALPHAGAQEAARFRRRIIAFGLVVNSAVAGDFNADGRLDVAAAGPEGIAWYERTIGSSFWQKHPIRNPTPAVASLDSIWLLTYDMDGDGDLDVVSSTPGNGNLAWYANPGASGAAWTWHLVDRLPKVHSHALEDLNRDGRAELVAHQENAIVWYTIPRDPGPLLPASYTGDPAGRPIWERKYLARSGIPGTPHYLNFADVDGDGDRDLCAGAPDAGYLAWWERPADPTLLWSKHLVRSPLEGATHLLPVDMDQDGQVDLFFSRGHAAGSAWLAGPRFENENPVDEGTLAEPHALTVADLDGDGDPDVVAMGRHSGGVAAWLNDGQGRFTRHNLEPEQGGMDLRVADLDGDGDRDVLIAGGDGKNVVWLENLRL